MENKKILLISTSFFNYELKIKKELEAKGYDVYLFDDRISNSTSDKLLVRFIPNLAKRKINKHFQNILDSIEICDIDILLYIKPEAMPIWFLDKAKEANPKMKTIMYMFDSVKNYTKILDKACHFDYKFTFDLKDAHSYGWGYRPLFYLEEFNGNYSDKQYLQTDFVMIGTLHSDRGIVLEKIRKQLDSNKNSKYFYLYVPVKIKKYIDLMIGKVKLANRKEIHTNSISLMETSDILKSSRVVIDIHHRDQNGLTMRTIESVGAKCKLITTNRNVLNEPFYHENNIQIIDRDNPVIDFEWVEKPYQFLDANIYNYYTLSNFLETLIKGGS